jgi:hypothetical protein
LLGWIAARDSIRGSPRELVRELRAAFTSLHAERAPERVAASVASDPSLLETLLLVRPVDVHRALAPWDVEQWRKLVTRAARPCVTTEPAIVTRLARALGRRECVAALSAGDLAALGVPPVTDLVVDGARHTVRLLDKRADLLTYLRFPDVSKNTCFRSDTWWYRDASFDSQGSVIRVWRDPLTFCFRFATGAAARPAGFVFGGFARLTKEDEVAIVLNGLDLGTHRDPVRFAVLAAIERALCGPLGIRHVGIANEYGAEGRLPDGYEQRPVTLSRYRALAVDGRAVTYAHDDIGCPVNEEAVVEHLWWKQVPASGAIVSS